MSSCYKQQTSYAYKLLGTTLPLFALLYSVNLPIVAASPVSHKSVDILFVEAVGVLHVLPIWGYIRM